MDSKFYPLVGFDLAMIVNFIYMARVYATEKRDRRVFLYFMLLTAGRFAYNYTLNYKVISNLVSNLIELLKTAYSESEGKMLVNYVVLYTVIITMIHQLRMRVYHPSGGTKGRNLLIGLSGLGALVVMWRLVSTLGRRESKNQQMVMKYLGDVDLTRDFGRAKAMLEGDRELVLATVAAEHLGQMTELQKMIGDRSKVRQQLEKIREKVEEKLDRLN